MCALCGVLGIENHWSASLPDQGPSIGAAPRRGERKKRIDAANRLLQGARLKLHDWQGTAYRLTTPTGKSRLVDNLGDLWPAVEALTGHPVDPLAIEDPEIRASRQSV